MISEFAAVAVLLFAGHWVGDYWVQTDWQAQTKGKPAWEGRYACAMHVCWYTTTLIAFQLLGVYALHIPVRHLGMAAALVLSAATHYFADRRKPLRDLCVRLGKDGYWDNGGAPFLDQSWHLGWLAVCAVLVVTI